ncbi:hypothetical protein T4D_6525 [Trichinella pseudospiralis]|uniref:Uncharacterized protein n=1 Tax=Trichinella pseudospiralis TaxID=6337 RepID=A0A0V1FFG7_TRIPS|nr:hypothetical protein T4D_12387 [Trichinella pseudospiralis]KRY84673.1 hypothetical protein T4D_6525 [Trichinella pseudospiralis]
MLMLMFKFREKSTNPWSFIATLQSVPLWIWLSFILSRMFYHKQQSKLLRIIIAGAMLNLGFGLFLPVNEKSHFKNASQTIRRSESSLTTVVLLHHLPYLLHAIEIDFNNIQNFTCMLLIDHYFATLAENIVQ